jgi:hypothetical protein
MNNNNPTSEFSTDGKFDINKFNTSFDKSKEDNKLTNKENDAEILQKLNSFTDSKPLYKNTISEIIIGIKNTWFYLLDDLLEQKFTFDTFTKENRLFYIGITLVCISIILYFYNFFTSNDEDISAQKSNEKIIEKYYFYQQPLKPSIDDTNVDKIIDKPYVQTT